MEAVSFYFRNLEPAQSHYRFVLPFITFMVNLTSAKIMNIHWHKIQPGGDS